MKLKVVIHDAEEGGYWAEVPALPGCITEGDTCEELLHNLYDAVEGWLEVEAEAHEPTEPGRTIEITVLNGNKPPKTGTLRARPRSAGLTEQAL